jgi:hypothetical protein
MPTYAYLLLGRGEEKFLDTGHKGAVGGGAASDSL